MTIRYGVLESYAENHHVMMQYLGNFQSVTAAYWHFSPDHVSRLRLLDLYKVMVYDWTTCQRMMFIEQLQRLLDDQRITPVIMQALTACGYVEYEVITAKGYELIAQYVKPSIKLYLPYIKHNNKMNLKG